ncbi:MAG TPA: amino acid ABC transporter permease [Xanthobacteraceae bacterium]|jgi:general L-amino acid transport system permease protein
MSKTRFSYYNNQKFRAVLYQFALLGALAALAWIFETNARANLAAQGFASGFDFLHQTAGFGVSQSLISYQETDTYGRVFLVGLLNTLLVAGIGIVLATLLGFVVGIARLSPNWLLARLAGGYVEVIRNLPLLFQILFWYLAVLGSLPPPRASYSLFGLIFLNNRGIIVPAPVERSGAIYVLGALMLAILAAVALRLWAARRQALTGKSFPVLWASLGLIAGAMLLAVVAVGVPIGLERPELRGFNFVGGLRLIPEFVALLVALSTYTAAFIAEIVRAGILSVPRGQTEAALALGLRRGSMLRLVVVPQALRLIVPPLTSQYLNLTKNSSLAVAIGYPDLVAIFAGTTLNQTHQAIEIIALTMAVYLLISLITSLMMNWYNARLRLVER